MSYIMILLTLLVWWMVGVLLFRYVLWPEDMKMYKNDRKMMFFVGIAGPILVGIVLFAYVDSIKNRVVSFMLKGVSIGVAMLFQVGLMICLDYLLKCKL